MTVEEYRKSQAVRLLTSFIVNLAFYALFSFIENGEDQQSRLNAVCEGINGGLMMWAFAILLTPESQD